LKDAFIFVNGCNVSFEDAARRTGQFAYDLEFLGVLIFYWPSNGKFADYMNDENSVTSQRSGATRIHIIVIAWEIEQSARR
jgi:esterase/lipase superfamily enzyme